MKLGVYKHYSELIVLVIGVARHSETNEKLVAYVPLGVKAGPRLTVRPYDIFFEEVTLKTGKKIKRFTYLDETMPDDIAAGYRELSK